jgi:hypothetical protein
MTEITLNLPLSEPVKDMADKHFAGNLTADKGNQVFFVFEK